MIGEFLGIIKLRNISTVILQKHLQQLRKTKAKYGRRLIRKALRTKKYNAASKRIQAMNKRR